MSETQSSTFAELGLGAKVLAAVKSLGYESPSPVQEQAIPAVLAGKDVLAAAQTGTGKTAAFLLPVLNDLPHHGKAKGPLCLIVTPTRELAIQIEDVCQTICKKTGHRSVTVVGGVSYGPQRGKLARGCDVLVATPGRLVDLMGTGDCDLSEVTTLVIDEADRMLDMGFLPTVRKIVAACRNRRQTLLFSATLDEAAVGEITDLAHDPAVIEIARRGTAAQTIDQFLLPVSPEVKNKLLAKVLEREGHSRVIVFCRTKHRADAACRRLRKAGIAAAPIHGDRNQNQRERALRDFRKGSIEVLVATDVLARGIDVPDVDYVVNFDVPGDPEDYVHRIGRTGRAGEFGWALTFVTPDDVDDMLATEALMGRTVPAFERTKGLDLGTTPPELDPDRVPAKVRNLPASGKHRKSRTKAAAAKAVARQAKAGKGAGNGEPAPRKARRPRRQEGASGDGAASGTGASTAARTGESVEKAAGKTQAKGGDGRGTKGGRSRDGRGSSGHGKGDGARRRTEGDPRHGKGGSPKGGQNRHRGNGPGRSQRRSGSSAGWQSYDGPRPSKPARKKGRRPGDLGGKARKAGRH
ncbi:DEAD/DEAH box helicase [Caniella muris]|uniref:DEAD/DEAH box helicase n=1 Tax=Caniella muris TaxID=2941502 RepID=UPI00203CBB23|nr:DEAD/DEAH box helicase [Caniella muris]